MQPLGLFLKGVVLWSSFHLATKLLNIKKGQGSSMSPTFHSGDLFFVESVSLFSRWKKPIRNGDVVIFRAPTNSDELHLKRVSCLEGELLEGKSDWSYKGYSNWGLPGEGLIQVPRGSVWVEGDNPKDTYDSRHYGPVPINLISYRVVARIYPDFKWAYSTKNT